MGDKTHISWSDATWPVLRGCSKISPGCKGCWAIKDAHRMQNNPNPKCAAHFIGLTVVEGGKANWSGVVRLDEAVLDWPLKWKRARNIFVASSGDLFHEAASVDDIDSVFAVMQHAYSRGHRFQVLTKRAARAAAYLSDPDLYERLLTKLNWVRSRWSGLPIVPLSNPVRFPMKHIQIGFSAENQHWFDQRWPHMQAIAALGWMVWCSYEPALGPVDMADALAHGLRWIVCGGESGPDARPMHPDWARQNRDQCVAARVPWHFKQFGEYGPWVDHQKPIDSPGRVYMAYDGTVRKWTENNNGQDLRDFAVLERVGKKLAGRTLDGRLWDEFPEALHA